MDADVSLLTIKVIGTPTIVGGATLAGRRWGPTVAGWIGGLPLASGPLTLFLAIEQGPRFAAQSATATLAGLLGVATFAVVFCRLAPRGPWQLPVIGGVLSYVAVATVVLFAPLPALLAFALSVVALTLAIRLVGSPPSPERLSRPPYWDIPARALAATILVVGLSSLAATLGSRVVGLIAPFPIYASIMGGFTHGLYGPAASIRLVRGVLMGLYGFACFYLAVALLATENVAVAFVLGTATALVVQGGSMFLIRRFGW
jgi:hypothetical protein